MSNEKLRYYAQAMTIDAETGKPMPKVAIDGEVNIGDIAIDDVGISDNGNKLKVNADGSIVAQLTGSNVGLSDGENTLKINPDGTINIGNSIDVPDIEVKPKRIPIIGDIVEPYEEGYKGVVGIFGHALFWQSEIYEDEVGAIRQKGDSVYVATRAGRLIKYDFDGLYLWDYKLGNEEITDIAFDMEGNIYVGAWATGHVAKVSPSGEEIKRVNALFTVDGSARDVFAITDESPDGHLFICGGTFSGDVGAVMKIDTDLNVVTSTSISGRIQSAKFIDNYLIVGTIGSLRSLTTSSFVQRWSSSPSGAIEKLVYNKRNNNLFMVTRNMVYEVNQDSGALQSIKALNSDEIEGQGRSLAVGFDGMIYVGTGESKVYKITEQGEVEWSFGSKTGRVLALESDDTGNIYVGATDVKVISPDITFKGYKIVGGA